MQENADGEDYEPKKKLTFDLGVDVPAFRRMARTVTRMREDMLRIHKRVYTQTSSVRRMTAELANHHADVARQVRKLTQTTEPLKNLSFGVKQLAGSSERLVDISRQWSRIAEEVVRPALRTRGDLAAAMATPAPEFARTLRAAQVNIESLAQELEAVRRAAKLGVEPIDVEALRRVLDQIANPPEEPPPQEEAVHSVTRTVGVAADRNDWGVAETLALIALILQLHGNANDAKPQRGLEHLQQSQHQQLTNQKHLIAEQDSTQEMIRRRYGLSKADVTSRRVVVKTAPLRAEPAADAAVRDTLAPNRAVTPLEDSGSWLRVRAVDYADGGAVSGWVRMRAVIPADGVEEDG